jgi:Arc/MetJ family transcription regulator
MMRTTLDIDKQLLEEASKISGETSPSATVMKALAEFVRRKKVEELLALRGKITLAMTWEEMENLEMSESEAH